MQAMGSGPWAETIDNSCLACIVLHADAWSMSMHCRVQLAFSRLSPPFTLLCPTFPLPCLQVVTLLGDVGQEPVSVEILDKHQHAETHCWSCALTHLSLDRP